jgi:hypothetical protein
MHTKILNKILAKKDQLHINQFISQDQVVSIREIQGYLNTYKSINMTHHINRMKDKNHMHIDMKINI